eukprot:m.595061 g.595061  ORF g.595061 m.595061 type:complete len:86 (-) comp22399_c1_seq32:3764-4021(-)
MHQTKNHTAMSDASGAVLNLSSSPNAIYDQYFSLLGGMKLSSDVYNTTDVGCACVLYISNGVLKVPPKNQSVLPQMTCYRSPTTL